MIPSKGLHNIFTVLPQFVMTGMASIVFALTDYAPPALSDAQVAGNSTMGPTIPREEMLEAASKNAVVYVFRRVSLLMLGFLMLMCGSVDWEGCRL